MNNWPSSPLALVPLFAQLKNHSLVALLGFPDTSAIAIVPVAFVTLNSFGTVGPCGIATTFGRLVGEILISAALDDKARNRSGG